MKKNLPNVITCLNLATGCIGIYYILVKNEPMAIYFVLVGAFFDLFDGFLARMLKVSSEIGKQLDSLADLVTFGLLPSFYLLTLLQGKSDFHWIAIIVAIFSAIRLAIFNTDESQSNSFRGLPTPANAIMLTSLVYVPFQLNEWTLLSIAILSAALLVSNFRLIALKFENYQWKGNEARWILISGSIILFSVFRWTFLPFLIPFYVGVSVISNFQILGKP